jgi:hypothetical protein
MIDSSKHKVVMFKDSIYKIYNIYSQVCKQSHMMRALVYGRKQRKPKTPNLYDFRLTAKQLFDYYLPNYLISAAETLYYCPISRVRATQFTFVCLVPRHSPADSAAQRVAQRTICRRSHPIPLLLLQNKRHARPGPSPCKRRGSSYQVLQLRKLFIKSPSACGTVSGS